MSRLAATIAVVLVSAYYVGHYLGGVFQGIASAAPPY